MKNEAKMNEVRKAVTNYDISDQKECRFLFSCVYTELRSEKAVLPQFRLSLCSRLLLALTVRRKPLPAVRGTRRFVVGPDCAKASPLLPIGGRDAGWCAIGQS
jgi:hypothetical protein